MCRVRPGQVQFRKRDPERLDVEYLNTELVPGLVTSIAQTILDLSGDFEDERDLRTKAARNLMKVVDPDEPGDFAAISADLGDWVMFYGGTALARSLLPHGRLSEDIDLIAVGARADVAEALPRTLTRRLARDFGRPQLSCSGRLGPCRSVPSTSTIPAAPTETRWQRDLAHQTRLTMIAATARSEVVGAWAAVRRTATGC